MKELERIELAVGHIGLVVVNIALVEEGIGTVVVSIALAAEDTVPAVEEFESAGQEQAAEEADLHKTFAGLAVVEIDFVLLDLYSSSALPYLDYSLVDS